MLEVAYNFKGEELVRRCRFPQAQNMFKSAIVINSDFDVARKNLVEVEKILYTRQFSKTFIK